MVHQSLEVAALVCLCSVLVALFDPALAVAQPIDRRQVIFIRGTRGTTAKVDLTPGDHVAKLSVRRPPAGLLGKLKAQVGPALVGVERIERLGDTLRLALTLESKHFRIAAKRVGKKGDSWGLTILPFEYKQDFDTPSFVGRVPGSPPIRPWPFVAPKVPRRTPCRRSQVVPRFLELLDRDRLPSSQSTEALIASVKDGRCASYITARIAAVHLARNLPIDPFVQWAFLLGKREPWPAYPYPYSYAAAVAAGVLLRANYLPEVEVLLATDRIQDGRTLLPYRGLLMADLLAQQKDAQTATRLVRRIATRPDPADARGAAAIRLADLLSNRDLADARRLVGELFPSLEPQYRTGAPASHRRIRLGGKRPQGSSKVISTRN